MVPVRRSRLGTHGLAWVYQPDAPDGQDILWRERDGLRLVILTNPTPNRGAKLVKTVYRVQAQAKAIAGRHR